MPYGKNRRPPGEKRKGGTAVLSSPKLGRKKARKAVGKKV